MQYRCNTLAENSTGKNITTVVRERLVYAVLKIVLITGLAVTVVPAAFVTVAGVPAVVVVPPDIVIVVIVGQSVCVTVTVTTLEEADP